MHWPPHPAPLRSPASDRHSQSHSHHLRPAPLHTPQQQRSRRGSEEQHISCRSTGGRFLATPRGSAPRRSSAVLPQQHHRGGTGTRASPRHLARRASWAAGVGDEELLQALAWRLHDAGHGLQLLSPHAAPPPGGAERASPAAASDVPAPAASTAWGSAGRRIRRASGEALSKVSEALLRPLGGLVSKRSLTSRDKQGQPKAQAGDAPTLTTRLSGGRAAAAAGQEGAPQVHAGGVAGGLIPAVPAGAAAAGGAAAGPAWLPAHGAADGPAPPAGDAARALDHAEEGSLAAGHGGQAAARHLNAHTCE